jgi:aminoglycoside phosphotransferase (APT) family kinase protein
MAAVVAWSFVKCASHVRAAEQDACMEAPDHVRVRPPRASLVWAAAAVGGGARVVRWRRLKGGLSSSMHALTVERSDGGIVELVLRRYTGGHWADDRELAHRELAVLGALTAAGVPAPAPLAADDGTTTDVPAVLMTRLAGRPLLRPTDTRRWTGQLAEALAAVHDVAPPAGAGLPDERTRLAALMGEESPWRYGQQTDRTLWSAVRAGWPGVEWRPPTLIHDDFHPGNVLWHRGCLTGVVDWALAAVGQPASDVGYCRVDLALCVGGTAPDELLAAYEATTGCRVPDRPWWDLVGASRAAPDPRRWLPGYHELGRTDLTPRLLRRRLDDFVAEVSAELR